MDCIKHLIAPHKDEIASAENEMASLAYKMYELVLGFLEEVLHYKWQGPNSKLAIFGGIMINCDGDGTDMFLPLMFETRSNQGEDKKDLFEETFGVKPKLYKDLDLGKSDAQTAE